MKKFELGQTIYYTGRKDERGYRVQLSSNGKSEPEPYENIYNEVYGALYCNKIIKILNRCHSFTNGFFDTFLLENGTTINSYDCFESPGEWEVHQLEMEQKRRNAVKFTLPDKIQMPIIKRVFPNLAADDIISTKPI